MSILGRFARFLERPNAVKWQVVTYLYILSCYYRTRDYYDKNYAHQQPKGEDIKQFQCSSTSIRCSSPPFSSLATSYQPETGRRRAVKFASRLFPKRPILFSLVRLISTVYLSYVIIKFAFKDQIAFVVDHFVERKLPIQCYLMGRFILHPSVAESMAAVFSVLFVTWRFKQSYSKPYRINLFYFLVQGERDRELAYSRLELGGSGALQVSTRPDGARPQLMPRERILLDTMCYRVVYPNKVIFRLRSNRTREAELKLRRLISKLTLIALFILTLPGFVLASYCLISYLLDARYLQVYPNCDPELEKLNRSGKLGAWSMTMRSQHRLMTFFADSTENITLWLECGLIVTFGPAAAYLLNYDLVLQWSGIKRKIERLEAAVRHNKRQEVAYSIMKPSDAIILDRPASRHQLLAASRERYELAAEISDFFDQIDQASGFLEQFLNCGMIGCLSLCASYTYFLQSKSIHQLPLPVFSVVAFVACALSFGYYSFIMVHKFCMSSYFTLCSLMANDPFKQDFNYGGLIEFYVEQRDCFLLLGQFRFLPTTFLTIIGWTFSCFCIITEVLQRSTLKTRPKW